jgi:hypothetical protein
MRVAAIRIKLWGVTESVATTKLAANSKIAPLSPKDNRRPFGNGPIPKPLVFGRAEASERSPLIKGLVLFSEVDTIAAAATKNHDLIDGH